MGCSFRAASFRDVMKKKRERTEAKKRKAEQDESRFTQGSSDGLMFSWASGVRVAGLCCTATVTRVTSLQHSNSAASRCLHVRTFRTEANMTRHSHFTHYICLHLLTDRESINKWLIEQEWWNIHLTRNAGIIKDIHAERHHTEIKIFSKELK